MREIINHSCDHIGLCTNNIEKLLNFYIKKLGFKREKEEILPSSVIKSIFGIASSCRFIRLISDEIKLEIFQPNSIRLQKRLNNFIGYNHWGFCVGDREKFCRRLKRKKVNIIEVRRNNHRVYFIKDPDGNRIEIRD